MNTFIQHLKTHTSIAGGLMITLLVASGAAVYYFSQASTLNAVQLSAQPQTPSVEVVTVQPQSIRLWNEFSGRLRAVNHVEVRPE